VSIWTGMASFGCEQSSPRPAILRRVGQGNEVLGRSRPLSIRAARTKGFKVDPGRVKDLVAESGLLTAISRRVRTSTRRAVPPEPRKRSRLLAPGSGLALAPLESLSRPAVKTGNTDRRNIPPFDCKSKAASDAQTPGKFSISSITFWMRRFLLEGSSSLHYEMESFYGAKRRISLFW
jgi:hypothetical protein